MPVSEFGEIGVLVKVDLENKLVIHWRARAKGVSNMDNELYGFKKGDKIYKTSMGIQSGLADGSDYFEPTERERSLKPCVLRALKYAEGKWPTFRNETH